MKNLTKFRNTVLAAVFLLAGISAYAQDLIVLKDGTMIEVKVMKLSPTEIEYKRFNHLDGPIIVILKTDVLSIRYENGTVEVISAAPATGQAASQEGIPVQLSQPSVLQNVLNALSAVRIAGNSLKFEFGGESWVARVNGENFSAGTIEFEENAKGGILTLKQTHIWPGAMGKTAGKVANMVPGGAAVGNVLNTAGNLAGALGPVEASGTIVLEYRAGPPASLKFVKQPKSAKEPKPPKPPNDPLAPEAAYLNTLGISMGISPEWRGSAFVTSIQGTFASGKYLFFEVGMDFGFGNASPDFYYSEFAPYEYKTHADYFSFSPYLHFGAFVPFTEKSGWYIAPGIGYTYMQYTFDDVGEISGNLFTVDFTTGFFLWGGFLVSYTMRTDFDTGIVSTFALGYRYRFK